MSAVTCPCGPAEPDLLTAHEWWEDPGGGDTHTEGDAVP